MSENLLIFADSERDADMLYAVGMFVPDPFIFLRLNAKSIVVMSDLEVDRARREAVGCRVISSTTLSRRMTLDGTRSINTAAMIRHLLGQHEVRKVWVPDNFPLALARQLEKLGVKVKERVGSFFPERERKQSDEVKKIALLSPWLKWVWLKRYKPFAIPVWRATKGSFIEMRL